jgi:hypothetical protein
MGTSKATFLSIKLGGAQPFIEPITITAQARAQTIPDTRNLGSDM